ncbi:M23 family metallopeptidase [Aquipuribacter sp. MA13-6]|uniref:M23 family metallopeptidase n=1 Tax=unclassified Aquipuribacter TaxID=2635084 RepID=UPI003EEE7C2A
MQAAGADAVALRLPFDGTWLTQNSPARRVPSHGTHLFATTYAIDFVAVDGRRRSGSTRDWRTWLATEPPERFVGFGAPVLAPAAATVVDVHDGEPDHEARRSQVALVPYALTQGSRARGGAAGLAGNHVVLRLYVGGAHVLLAHLRRGSLRVAPGDRVALGQPLGACGNSGNSTEPHVHLQAMDGPDGTTARGLPVVFLDYRVYLRGGEARVVGRGVPGEAEVVETIRPGAGARD